MANCSSNPWLGLKSYSEGKILYGRDKETEELSQKILYNTQTVIYGRSGIGKSSLLKAGVFPILRRNGYFPVYVRFVHEEGQGSYTNQIITAVDNALKRLKIEDLSAPDADVVKFVEGYKEEIVPANNADGKETMWEFFHRYKFYYKLNEEDEPHTIFPVLIFDQFEEIFTLQKNEHVIKGFFDEFAGLLNNVCPKYLLQSTIEVGNTLPQSTGSSLIKRGLVKTSKRWDYIDETNLHVVLSLREDFLSYLERNIEHIPSLKHNRYCLLPLNEDQAAEVIMQPIPGLVSVEVAKEIICKVTGAKYDDFEIDDNPELEVDSAILSLFLSELYEKKGDALIITDELVEHFGSNIISDYYERTVNNRSQISEESVFYLEKRLVTREERRDSIFDEQALRHGVTRDELKYLYDCRLLHQYPWRDGIRIEFSHDVLCPIVIERRKKRDEILEKQRQHDAYLKLKRDKRHLMFVWFLTIFSLIVTGIFVYDGWFDIKVERYAKVTKEFTWIKGVKPLSEHEASYLNYHYVFYKKGRWAEHADSIEARNGYGELTTEHNMGTYLVNQFDDTDNKADQQIVNNLKTVVKWVMVSDNTGKYCLQEKAYDQTGKLIFSFNNSIIDEDSVFISTYVDEYGFPIVMRDSCYIYLRTTMDKEGHQILQEFFNDKGFPVMNKDGSFQTARSYFPNGIQKNEASQFLNGHRMIDRFGNCGWEILEISENGYDEVLSVYFDADRKPCRLHDGVMFKRWDYDEYGRITKETYWKLEDSDLGEDIDLINILLEIDVLELLPDTNKNGVHGEVYEYNRHGQMTLFYAINIEGNPVKRADRDFVKLLRGYDAKGNLTNEIGVDGEGRNIWEYNAEYAQNGDLLFNKSYNINSDNDTIMNYHLCWNEEHTRKIEKDYYGDYYAYNEYDSEGNKLIKAWYKTQTNEPDDNLNGLHKTLYDYQYDKEKRRLTITERYFDKNGNICGYEGTRSFSKEIIVVDSLLHTKSIIRYTTRGVYVDGVDYLDNAPEIFYKGTEKWYNEDFTISLGEASLDIHGMKRRTYENDAYYYQVKYVNSILPSHANEYNGHYAINEFGEPSLIRYDGVLYSAKYDGCMYDEYGHEVDEEELDRPLFAAIETDVDLGFMDGDILVLQDDWVLWRTGSFNDLDLEPKPNIDHHFNVLRFNETKGDYDVIEINVPEGDERVTQIEYKKFYMTKAEENRVYGVMREKVYDHVFEFVPNENGAIYERGMKSPALVLSVNDWDMTRHYGGDRDSFINVLKQQKSEIMHIMVYDEELEKVQTYMVDSDTLGVKIKSYSVRPRYYNKLKQEMLKHKSICISSDLE